MNIAKIITFLMLAILTNAKANDFQLKCIKVNQKGMDTMYRCHNQEVVCYHTECEGIQCKFKTNN